MRKLSIKEFASATGQRDATVRQHINRKKLIKTKDGFIDVDTVLSKTYIAEVTNGAGLYGAVVKTVKVKDGKSKLDKPEKTDEQKQIDEWDMRARKSRTETSEREAELKAIQLEKSAGNLLPVDIVEKMMVITFQSVFVNFESTLENMGRIMGERYGASRSEVAAVVKRGKEELNASLRKAKEDAAHEMKTEIAAMQESKK